MKNSILAIAILFASIGQAEVIKCVFTEPFINTSYDTSKSQLTYESYDYETSKLKKVTQQKVSFQIKAAGVFELVSSKGKVLQKLTLNGKGSDGMSDKVYPYEVQDFGFLSFANSGIGGCSSTQLKVEEATNP